MEVVAREDVKMLIKFVALYLRKSRGDVDKDLEKHKKILIDMCVDNNWKYVMYEEVESGDNIVLRPIMQKLLDDINEGVYDAVCVVDIDRLGRGDMGDQDRINKAFSKSSTLIVTPQHTYNLENENDEFNIEMRGFVARIEYKQIVKRLTQGKKVGARMGMWTNGIPPFPYEYETYKDKHNKKGIVVNDDKLIIYRRIIDSYTKDKKSTNTIAWELNKDKILSPRGNQWSNVTINRLLIDETHLGKIISNKTVGNAHVKKKPNAKEYKVLPRSSWIIIENCHESVKTQEEHDKIILILGKMNKQLHRDYKATPKKLPLTSLFKCAICGRTLTVYRTKDRKYSEAIKPCWYKDEVGNKCPNSGMYIIEEIYNDIAEQIYAHEEAIRDRVLNQENSQAESIDEKIKLKQKEINKKESALRKVVEAYEGDVYTLAEFKERKTELQSNIEDIKEDINILERSLRYDDKDTNELRLERIKKFRNTMNHKDRYTDEQLNDLYKCVIDRIEWIKQGNDYAYKVILK